VPADGFFSSMATFPATRSPATSTTINQTGMRFTGVKAKLGSADLEHAIERALGAHADVLGDLDDVAVVLERGERVLSVISFMWGQRMLHRRTVSLSGFSAMMLSPMLHSVRSRYRGAFDLRTNSIMRVVLPEKSDAATTSALHSGCASTTTSGNCLRTALMSSTVNFSCTSQRPFHPTRA
jgi:hypothetical protein